MTVASSLLKVGYVIGMLWLYATRPLLLGVALVVTLVAALLVRSLAGRHSS